jgi:hypothetical protein
MSYIVVCRSATSWIVSLSVASPNGTRRRRWSSNKARQADNTNNNTRRPTSTVFGSLSAAPLLLFLPCTRTTPRPASRLPPQTRWLILHQRKHTRTVYHAHSSPSYHSTVPGLSQDIYNLRRPLNTNVYYSCSQTEWDNLCRGTLVHDAKAKEKAIAALVKKSKAGKIHETCEGEQAQVRCTNCNRGGNGAGHPCYLPANSTVKTCAHCVYTNKSKCGMFSSLYV